MPIFSKTFIILGLIAILATDVVPFVLAESDSTDISYVYNISDDKTEDGDILTSDSNLGLIRAKNPYDPHLFGILQNQPLMVYRRIDNQGKAVSRNGTTLVNVTTVNGPINAGDYITSSPIPGKGQKAAGSGYVIGVALASLSSQNGTPTEYQPPGGAVQKIASGRVAVALKIEYAELTTPRGTPKFINAFSTALFQNVQDPNKFVQLLRYVASALTVIISFAVGFITFSRSIPKGIEAIGRNPLAQKAIFFSIGLNIFFTIITAGIGIAVAVLILRI